MKFVDDFSLFTRSENAGFRGSHDEDEIHPRALEEATVKGGVKMPPLRATELPFGQIDTIQGGGISMANARQVRTLKRMYAHEQAPSIRSIHKSHALIKALKTDDSGIASEAAYSLRSRIT